MVDLSGIMIVENMIQFYDRLSLFFFVKVLSRYPIWDGVGVNYTIYIGFSK